MDKRLMDARELAVYLAMPIGTVYAYVARGKFPLASIKRIGRALRFDKATIDQWVDEGAQLGMPSASHPVVQANVRAHIRSDH